MEFKDLYDEDLESLNDKENVKTEFVIDTPELANWALKLVKQEQERLELYEQAISMEIEMLKSKLTEERRRSENSTSWMRFKLNEYLDIAPSKKTKTQVSLNLPYGKIIRKLPKTNFVSLTGNTELKSDAKLIEWCKENKPELIKTEEKVCVDWAELKKDLSLKDDTVFITSTGEILECITTENTPTAIVVK